jgi:dolichyl-phosphate-mannose-protein mannosyltransferase
MPKSTKIYLVIVIAASVVTHFLFWGKPNGVVFDEVHFGKFITGYFTHQYFFDIHPPLGKLLISGMGYLTGFKPGFSFAEIGEKFGDSSYMWLRFLPMLAGTLLPIVIFLLILQLKLSDIAAFAGGMLVVFENSILVQSRFILLDAFLLLFGFSALLFYFIYENKYRKTPYLVIAAIFAALSLSVKWTGAVFLASIIILEIVQGLENHKVIKIKNYMISRFIYLLILPFAIYFSVFAVHLSLLNKTGQGDAFMTPAFQKTLAGNSNAADATIKPLNTFQKFIELNKVMYTSNASLTATHSYSSKWYSWPFMIRPVYYWYGPPPTIATSNAGTSRIYFLGNPVTWWFSTAALLYLLLETISMLGIAAKRKQLIALWKGNNLRFFILGSFFLNLLPFIGITRVMFLYHYMVALIFTIIALVYLIDTLKNKKKIFIGLILVSFAAFVFFAPLSYGLPLSEPAYNLRNWLGTWK